jgi:hypothetical protein
VVERIEGLSEELAARSIAQASRSIAIGICSVIGLAISGSSVGADEPEGKEQIWAGVVKVSPGVDLRLVFELAR